MNCVNCQVEVSEEEAFTCAVGSVLCPPCQKKQNRISFEDLDINSREYWDLMAEKYWR